MTTQNKNSDPRTAYRNAVDLGILLPDTRQFEVVGKLQDLHERLTGTGVEADSQTPESNAGKGGFFSSLFAARKESPPGARKTRGLYLWGGVGRGKTLLCDMLFSGLPFAEKHRVHFHRFMQDVHSRLAEIQNESSPLELICDAYAQEFRVLVLDEMHVNDITDAMLMSGLLNGLFSRGVTLVTTSNFQPDELYRDGLQRARFLPAIELIKANTEVVFLGGDIDFRLRALQNAEIYHTPLDEFADAGLEAYFEELVTAADSSKDAVVTINGRQLHTRRHSASVVWLSFDELCNTPRSTDDYIELARTYHTVLISGIPPMTDANSVMVRRFINMIDEFYDRNVKLVVTAQEQPLKLYEGQKLAFEFERTVSRLQEMQSTDYLALRHLA